MRQLTPPELDFLEVLWAEADETLVDIVEAFERIPSPVPEGVVDGLSNVKDWLRGLIHAKRIVTEKAGPGWVDGGASLIDAMRRGLQSHGVEIDDEIESEIKAFALRVT